MESYWTYCYRNGIQFDAGLSLQQQQTCMQIKTISTGASSPQGKVTTTTPSPTSQDKQPVLKPVECNLCKRRFKNIPALNGHMRLHGGYFKKVSAMW